MARMARAIAEFLVGILVAFLPERVKTREPWQRHSHAHAHAASGALQFCVAVVLYFVCLIRAISGSSQPILEVLFSDRGLEIQADKVNITAIGFLNVVVYMLSPKGMLLLYLVAEGIVRGIDPHLTEGRPGTALLSVPWWIADKITMHLAEKRELQLLGPGRPEQWRMSFDGRLEIFASRRQPFSPVQVFRWGERFFVLESGPELVEHAGGHAIRYRARPQRQGELIRAGVVMPPPGCEPPA